MADNIRIGIEELSKALHGLLQGYNEEIANLAKTEAKSSMDKLVKETKATAPTRRPRYRNSITSRLEWENKFGAEYTWYVKGSEYRLSHLLERGHLTRNGGRTKAFHFIQNASEPIIEDYIRKIEDAIKNG